MAADAIAPSRGFLYTKIGQDIVLPEKRITYYYKLSALVHIPPFSEVAELASSVAPGSSVCNADCRHCVPKICSSDVLHTCGCPGNIYKRYYF